MEQLTSMCDMVGQYIQKKEEEKQIEEVQAAKARYWKILVCYDDDDDEDCTIAITPILSTKEPDNSLSMGDEHLETIPATKSNEFIKSSVENLVPIPSEFEGIPDNMCDVLFHDNSPPLDISKDQFADFSNSNDDSTSIDDDSFSIDNIEYVEASPPDSKLIRSEVIEIVILELGWIDDDILLTIKYDILHENLLNINLLIANIEALKDNPTPSSDFMTKSSSTSLNFLLEETITFDNSLPESETFCFDLKEISSGSTTTRSDISLPDYEAFYDNHVKEISSGSTTTHSDSSLYDLFIFDLSINPFPSTDRSDFYLEEFADELAHIISLPEYDCFYFKNEPNSRDFTMDVVEDIFPTREPRVHVHNALPTHPTLQLNLDFILSSESLFAYVVWIFLPFLSYSIVPQYLLSFTLMKIPFLIPVSPVIISILSCQILSIRESSRRMKNDNVKLEACAKQGLFGNPKSSYVQFVSFSPDTSAQRSESSSFITSSFDSEIVALKAEMAEINRNLMKVLQINQQVKVVTHSCETCGGPHSYNDCPATIGHTQNIYAEGSYNQGGNSYQPQGASHGQNSPPAYQASAYQAPGYQAPVHQAPIPQSHVMTSTEFTNYMKANDAILKNMQMNMTSLTNSNLAFMNMFGQFMKMSTASSSGLGSLPSNTVTNPKEDLKGITTLSGIAYKGPTIPTTSSPLKVVERETEVTKDTVPPTNNGSTKDVQPPVVQVETQIPNFEPVVTPVVEPVKAPISALKPNPNLSIPYPMTLELADRSISRPVGVTEDVSVKVGRFHFPTDFVVIDFDVDPDLRYSAYYDAELINRIDVIDVACEEYSQEILGFSVSGNLTPSTEPTVSTSSLTLTPFGDSDFLLEETDAFLATEDEPISPEINDSYYDSEGDILLLEALLNDDSSSPPLPP
nr:hypothetical protein [Tanacetum cinerariifolium]